MTKKKSKRSKSKYPGLVKNLNRWNIQQYMDMDYIDQLNDKEKEFLSKFVVEDYSADFRHEKTLTKNKEKRREIYRNNNARNVDLYSQLYTHQKLDGMEVINSYTKKVANNIEDELIAKIDLAKKFKK